MIDNRFTLVPDPRPNYKHLFHLQFTVVIPKDGSCYSDLELCKQQYPELEFEKPIYHSFYTVKFPDGQTTASRSLDDNEDLLFSLPLELDTIMGSVCSFKKAVPPIKYCPDPAELLESTPEDFYQVVEDMYSEIGFDLHIRAISFEYTGSCVYRIQATDYDFI